MNKNYSWSRRSGDLNSSIQALTGPKCQVYPELQRDLGRDCPGGLTTISLSRFIAHRSLSGDSLMEQNSVGALWRLKHTWGQRMKLLTRRVAGRPLGTVACS